jgi:acetylornithine deacetylase/succinyl-diaminopimelate desuccinylase-like protein
MVLASSIRRRHPAGCCIADDRDGDPQYAHRDDERVEMAALERSVDVLRAFLEEAGKG